MKVISVKESVELCTESGWSAYDMILDGKIEKAMIDRLGALGDLTYLGMLKQPFYKVEQALYMIKGLEGADQLRVAMLVGEEAILDRVRQVLEEDVQDEKEAGYGEKNTPGNDGCGTEIHAEKQHSLQEPGGLEM